MPREVRDIPIELIDPREDQPRQCFDPQALAELADSIRAQGVINPVTVRRRNGRWDLLAGHRRRLAALDAGLDTLPAIVHDEMTDADADRLVLLDNLSREDLQPWEEGAGYAALMQAHGMTAEEVAEDLGRPVRTVRSRVRIHEGAGAAAREAYAENRIGVQALTSLCDLPAEPVEVVECPDCGVRTQADECPKCGRDLALVMGSGATDLQALALRQAGEGGAAVVADMVEHIRRQYGLAEDEEPRAPARQAGMGMAVEQVDPTALRLRKELERRLGAVGSVRDWCVEHRDVLAGRLPAHTAAALVQQIRAAQTALRQVADIIEEEERA